ncbi:hypothetical protein GGTG_11667 [Gaeumannomyces tritici R3-111a-1]|uniref:Uncharacterized protein n=1 Tax=Gaeumannomyces tritici (strain R3-111a-1) TaxID=644352 RepID=J3PDU4_GAET3|nr:hypothetical protein GGTG_11667 [Gaeumannomyces tritici R3-111a-1]EJT70644.1 hypothetical protein GGTG_11667 [Gaeumannomyces tritici R3-111a-1]
MQGARCHRSARQADFVHSFHLGIEISSLPPGDTAVHSAGDIGRNILSIFTGREVLNNPGYRFDFFSLS